MRLFPCKSWEIGTGTDTGSNSRKMALSENAHVSSAKITSNQCLFTNSQRLRFELNFNVATRFTRPQRALVTRKILYKNKKILQHIVRAYVKTMKFLFIRADTRVMCCAYSYIVSSPSPRGKRRVKVRQNVTTITTYKAKKFYRRCYDYPRV